MTLSACTTAEFRARTMHPTCTDPQQTETSAAWLGSRLPAPPTAAASILGQLQSLFTMDCLSYCPCGSLISLRCLCQQVDVSSSKAAVVQTAMLSIRGRDLWGASKPWQQQLAANHTADSCCFSSTYAEHPVQMEKRGGICLQGRQECYCTGTAGTVNLP